MMTRAISLAFLMLTGTGAFAEEINGKVSHVVDGDTFDVAVAGQTIRIRTCGIDSPEIGQPRSTEALDYLSKMILNKNVRCVRVGEGSVCDGRSKETNRGRVVAQCFLDKDDIATLMVNAGLACDWPKFSDGHYQHVANKDKKVCVR